MQQIALLSVLSSVLLAAGCTCECETAPAQPLTVSGEAASRGEPALTYVIPDTYFDELFARPETSRWLRDGEAWLGVYFALKRDGRDLPDLMVMPVAIDELTGCTRSDFALATPLKDPAGGVVAAIKLGKQIIPLGGDAAAQDSLYTGLDGYDGQTGFALVLRSDLDYLSRYSESLYLSGATVDTRTLIDPDSPEDSDLAGRAFTVKLESPSDGTRLLNVRAPYTFAAPCKIRWQETVCE